MDENETSHNNHQTSPHFDELIRKKKTAQHLIDLVLDARQISNEELLHPLVMKEAIVYLSMILNKVNTELLLERYEESLQ